MKSIIHKPLLRRRQILKGLCGVTFALPFLESLAPRGARAQEATDQFVIFFRQANGVAQGGDGEPDRFWPTTGFGALTDAGMAGQAVDELTAHRSRLLMLGNVNMQDFPYGDGHARGCMQALTARGPVVPDVGGDSEADGESIDHRIGVELNPAGRDSLFMYSGQAGGWLNGPSISYRSSNVRRTALSNPFSAYVTLFGASSGNEALEQQILLRGRSVNDLVKEQLSAVMSMPRISRFDRDRLQLHLDSVRDLEISLSCRFTQSQEQSLEDAAPGFDSTDGDQVLETARLQMDVGALAVSCGLTKAVTIQVGVGNDGNTRYRDPDGNLMENYHYLSHRQLSHGSDGAPIANADLLHHYVDRQFAQTFNHLLDTLAAIPSSGGAPLIERGVSIWYNDNSNGPPHGARNVPWILAGSCGGFFRQGEYLELNNGDGSLNHARLLNTIGSAVGLRKADGSFIDDHGDPSLPRTVLTDVMI